MPRWLPIGLALLALAGPGCEVGRARPRRGLDGSMGAAWPAARAWSGALEDDYSAFVARVSEAVAAGRCDHLDACLADPGANPTYDPEVDEQLRMPVDCADLPYVLRAYFSFKRQLPFGFVSGTRSESIGDVRYAIGVTPAAWRSWRDFSTPRALLTAIRQTIHSGMYRVPAETETGDFYPVRIDRGAVRPGTVFYDPQGHVSVVGQVREDGVVFFLAGAPDGVLTWKRLGSGYVIGSKPLGGGFKRFRPLSLVRGTIVRTANRDLADFDGSTQYDLARDLGSARIPECVRERLVAAASETDPVRDLRDAVRTLCRDVMDRIEAVDQAVDAGMAARPHPGRLPLNIYTADQDWETYSTPSRDARLKAAFRDLAEAVLALENLQGMAPLLRTAWDQEVRSPACQFAYRDSTETYVQLTLDDVLDRLFDLSFDPYHCPELRWGAPAGSAEVAACPDDAVKLQWYRAEERLRRRIERSYGMPTPIEAGPDEPPAIDLRRLVGPPLPDLDL